MHRDRLAQLQLPAIKVRKTLSARAVHRNFKTVLAGVTRASNKTVDIFELAVPSAMKPRESISSAKRANTFLASGPCRASKACRPSTQNLAQAVSREIRQIIVFIRCIQHEKKPLFIQLCNDKVITHTTLVVRQQRVGALHGDNCVRSAGITCSNDRARSGLSPSPAHMRDIKSPAFERV